MNSYVCAKCNSEMICKKTGCDIVWNELVVTRADEYQCKICGTLMRVTNRAGYTRYEQTKNYDLPITIWEY